MKASILRTREDRCLCKVEFELDPSDPDTYFIEVIYEIFRPAEDDFTLANDPYFMEQLSCTRTDTRETVILSRETEREVKKRVMSRIAAKENWAY